MYFSWKPTSNESGSCERGGEGSIQSQHQAESTVSHGRSLTSLVLTRISYTTQFRLYAQLLTTISVKELLVNKRFVKMLNEIPIKKSGPSL